MISEDHVRNALIELFGESYPRSIKCKEIADKLSATMQVNNIALSAYGYIRWMLDHYGFKGVFYKNILGADSGISGYTQEARKYKEDMKDHLINAQEYATKVLSIVQDPDMCIKRLVGMSYPYVLYVLFKSVGQENIMENYKQEAIEHMRRYPGTLELLPDRFANIGKELLNGYPEHG